MTFKAGDRLRSKRSGRVWVYAIENPPATGENEGLIPVRDELWAPPQLVWMSPSMFELVDEDYIDTARAEHEV